MKPGDQPKPKTQHFGDEHPVANYFGGHLEGFDPYIACLNQHFMNTLVIGLSSCMAFFIWRGLFSCGHFPG